MLANSHSEYLADLPGTWKRTALLKLGTVLSGGTPSRTNALYWDGPIAWVTPSELTNLGTKEITKSRDTITDSGLSASSATLLPAGSLVVTTRATIGNVGVAGIPLATNQGFKNLVLNGEADADFYYHVLKFINREFVRLASGTTFLEISAKDFSSVVVPLPPPPEQRRIAEILDGADEAVRQTERVVAKLKAMKVGLLNDLLTRGLDDHGRLRDPEAHPEKFKDSPLGKIPREWQLTTVGNLGAWRGGSTPSKSVPSNWNDGEIVWITPKDVRDTEVADSEAKITDQAARTIRITIFDPGKTVIVFRSGILRHTFPVAVVRVPFTINQDMKVLLPRPGVEEPFAFWSLQGISLTVLRLAVKAGTTVESIDADTFYGLPIALPLEAQEQLAIADMLDRHQARISAEETELAKLRHIKLGLMDELLTGTVRIP